MSRQHAPVGIVVVSHSQVLADAAIELARQMLPGQDFAIEAAAGLDETTLGTDSVRIHDAIARADRGAGVVVLMDMGSAVLSAEVALELLDPEAAARVVLSSAPLVEGLIVAAIAASGGAARADVAAEAETALAGKQTHLGASDGSPRPGDASDAVPADARTLVVRLNNTHGLHARPAAQLVRAARESDASIKLRNRTTGSDWVAAESLSAIATLGVLHGHDLEMQASGDQAGQALNQLAALVARTSDEGAAHTAAPETTGVVDDVHTGGPLPASAGIAVGPARIWRTGLLDVADTPSGAPASEWDRLSTALEDTRAALRGLHDRALRELGAEEAAVFGAHLLLLDDPDLVDKARARLDEGLAAESAWAAAVRVVRDSFANLADPYQRARAADITDVGEQVLHALLGERAALPTRGGILVTEELTPAAAAELDPDRVGAVVQAFSSPTAHSAILLRARGIPAVTAAGPDILTVEEGTMLAVDGSRGVVVVDPDPTVQAEFRGRAAKLAAHRRHALRAAAEPAVTLDGIAVPVGANVDSVTAARAAADNGADLAGLVRTEFLFLDRADPPGIDEQQAAYRAIAEAMGGLRVTLRTLDVGGDKPLRYLPMPAEANPFLGVRGIRLSMIRPDLFADQLRAMLRVAHETPVSVMFPMVTTLAELKWARGMVDDAVRAEGRGTPAGLEVGVMIEVPAAALKAQALAPHVDFFSLGTNDLTQYTLAAERGSSAVASIADPLDPAVVQLIAHVCRAGKPVAVCGELAADEQAAALLVGLGVRRLSVAAPAVPMVKSAVRRLDGVESSRLAIAAASAGSAAEVRALLSGVPTERNW